MYRRNDPRLRRTLNELSQTIESANESAQAGLFDFNQKYIAPCFAGIGECLGSCTKPCFGTREEQLRRQRRRARGRAELNFDFYDDWEDEEDGGLLGWGNNDELDRLLAGSGAGSSRRGKQSDQQPGRQRAMSYGTRRDHKGRKKSSLQPHDGDDPTIIPHSSVLGFMDRLPWRFGAKNLRYKPSAADLTENPGGYHRAGGEEAEALIDDQEEEASKSKIRHKRGRSDTGASGHTTDSRSSRGDIFPSEDELDDAQPLDDEFAMVLERRTTNLGSDEASSGKSNGDLQSSISHLSLRRASSKSSRDEVRMITSPAALGEEAVEHMPTLTDLKQEEEQIRQEEEAELERKRVAAQRLAAQRGLSIDEVPKPELKPEASPNPPSLQSPEPRSDTETFPLFDANARPLRSPSFSQPASPGPEAAGTQSTDDFVPAQLPRFGQG